MPRANRYILPGHAYHVTHRCHDRSFLLKFAVGGDRGQFARDYAAALEDAIDRGGLRREPHWSEAIAVGSKEYVTGIAKRIKGRMRIKINETADGAWAVHEAEATYGVASADDLEVPYGPIPGTKIKSGFARGLRPRRES